MAGGETSGVVSGHTDPGLVAPALGLRGCHLGAASFPFAMWVIFTGVCSLHTKVFLELSS